MEFPFFSIIIASKNEEEDIRLAIESSVSQTYKNKEIICVDDSSDRTKEIISCYKHKGVTLLNGLGTGCCNARNHAMYNSKGDVIVFLTADTKLYPDYLKDISKHYLNGYDIVMVSARVFNTDNIYAEFIEMQHRYEDVTENADPYTTQGYSVRKSAAIMVGGISGGTYPYNTCRDWTLVKKMQEYGFTKIYDRSIVVSHKAPDHFSDYWNVRKTRGLMSPYQLYFLHKKSKIFIFFKITTRSILTIFGLFLIWPFFGKLIRISRFSQYPIINFIRYLYPYTLQKIAFLCGEWIGLKNLIKLG